MLNNKLKELEALRAKAAELEAAIVESRKAELKALPAEYGFDSPEAFIDAVLDASGKRPSRQGRKGATASGRKPRAVITDETRARVKALVKAGKTGAEIAEEVGISLPSVQNVKKALGLVRK